MIFLAAGFLLTAIVYAAVGFGGGSTYTALLAFSDIHYAQLPPLSLSCNILVVLIGFFRFRAAGQVTVRCALPWLVFSIPLAWLGGQVPLSEKVFYLLLGASLLTAGLIMTGGLRASDMAQEEGLRRAVGRHISLPVGAALGLLSGMTGIGGGIFLAPVLHIARAGTPKQIAGICSLFILCNSLAGLVGHLGRMEGGAYVATLTDYAPLLLAVIAGGAIGSYMGALRLPQAWVAALTGVLVVVAGVRLLYRSFALS